MNTSQHAHVSCKIGGFKDSLIVPSEVEVDNKWLQLLCDDP